MIASVRRLISRGDIDGVSIAPRVALLDAERRHDAGIFVQPHAMKGGLNEPPLAGVQRAVARQQPVAEQPPRAAQRSPFDEPMMVRHQHLLDVVGMIQQKHVERAEPEVRDVAVLGAHSRAETPTDRGGSREGCREAACHAAQVETHENLTLPRQSSKGDTSCDDRDRAESGERRRRAALACAKKSRNCFDDAGIDARIRELADPERHCRPPCERRSTRIPKPSSRAAEMERSARSPSALAGTSTPLGVLPLGTLNHFAKDAGIPLDLPKGVQTVAARPHEACRRRARERSHLHQQLVDRRLSELRRVARAAAPGRDGRNGPRSRWQPPTCCGAKSEVTIRLEGDRARISARTPFVFVGNNEYLAEGLKLGARTRLDAGRLYAYFAPPVRTRDLPKLFAQALFGLARREHALESMAGPSCGSTRRWRARSTSPATASC